MTKKTIIYKDPEHLSARSGNPRRHSKKQIRQIAESIKAFGFNSPVLVDAQDCLIAGHGRVEAAKLAGVDLIPTICLNELSEAQIRAYVVADNRLAELADWDREALAIELQDLCELDLDYDLTVIGYETAEIDSLIYQYNADPVGEGLELPEIPSGPQVTRPGDVWQIGEHRLICGDSTNSDTYLSLLGEAQAEMVFTDPPYNVPIDGHVSGLGRTKHQDFAMASGEMTPEAFTCFLRSVFDQLANHSCVGAIHFICMDWRHMEELQAAAKDVYHEFKNLCVWAKTNGGMGSLYRSQHELVFVYKVGSSPHINNVDLGKHGRNRTNLWTYGGINAFGKSREAALETHPTVKPVGLIKDAILDCSHRNGIILDAFAGSGTTLMAAETVGRRGYGIEIDPGYCDQIVRRLQEMLQQEALLEGRDIPFAEVARERSSQERPSPNSWDVQPDTVGRA